MLGTLRHSVARRWRATRLLPSLGVLWESQPSLTLAVSTLCLAAGLVPALFALVTGNLVGALSQSVTATPHAPVSRSVIIALVLLSAVLITGDLVAAAQSVLLRLLQTRFTHAMRRRALMAVQRPVGIAHLEDPALLEHLSLVRDQMKWEAGDLVSGGSLLLTRFVQGLAAMVLVGTFAWWAAFLLAVMWLAAWASALRVTTHGLFDQLTALRRADYLRRVATQPAEAKEVRLFGLHGWLLDRYTGAWRAATASLWQAARADRRRAALSLIGVTVAHALVFVVLARAATAGHLALSQVAILVQAILAMGVLGDVSGALWLENGVHVVLPVRALERALATHVTSPGGDQAVAGLPTQALRCEGVRFRYPGRTEDALCDLNLEIPAGRSLAIVGDNGAGKTTLVKLLARLYDPDAGRVTVDGRDVRTYDPVAWRSRLAALFQDFIHYELSVADNIGFGAPPCQDDHAARERAADRAGARPLIEDLPQGWATVLSPRYAGGVDLSGGQWQRIALARALFAIEAGASILILDEPTAALDVRAEADLFDRFLSLTQGLTTILVSHRFSTVRRADRIVVLAGGRIVEEGTHETLITAEGRYARMFAVQADRFTSAGEPTEGQTHA